jgi:hypothetical protein
VAVEELGDRGRTFLDDEVTGGQDHELRTRDPWRNGLAV